MSLFNKLTDVLLNEAPLSSYAKAIGRTVTSPSAYLKGGANVLRGAQSLANVFTTQTKTLPSALGAAAGGAEKAARGVKQAGKWFKDPNSTERKWWSDKDTGAKLEEKLPKPGDAVQIYYNNQPYPGRISKKVFRNNTYIYRVTPLQQIPASGSKSPVDSIDLLITKSGNFATIPGLKNKPVGTINNRAQIRPTSTKGRWVMQA